MSDPNAGNPQDDPGAVPGPPETATAPGGPVPPQAAPTPEAPSAPPQGWSPPPPQGGVPAPAYGYPPAVPGSAPVGKVRETGVCILLMIVTFGIYSLFWYFAVHDEMKRHKGTGLGGGIALLIAFFVGIAMPYLTSQEVGEMYERRGQHPPVTWVTGLWNFPGIFILVGPIVWFVKTNGALNAYWRSLGAQ
jgi:hypothetical protein